MTKYDKSDTEIRELSRSLIENFQKIPLNILISNNFTFVL
ncbi:hypothetical protein CEV32_2361 [Brucella rhizosphaerae]|uniref:Uncharacterized protein n=1 Tax=Brucella rhizosphaerae TaxID=571254 RepID=A0A256F503_9HYPH|nr:hypothetical protein CEV32_2361 [Brucella rhizosphaerae]